MKKKRKIRCILPQKFGIERCTQIQSELSISYPSVQILLGRGYEGPQEMKEFLFPSLDALHDPFLLRDMDRATDRIIKAIKGKEPILIYGDYDVDGITSIAVLVKNFIRLGADVYYYIPNRIKEGYGLSEGGIRSAGEKGFKLIITVDCGINASDEVKLAKSLGIDVIITDHHIPRVELKDAFAVIDPLSNGEVYPFKKLAGVGVAFKLLEAIFSKLNMGKEELFSDLDLVALGTVADVVPLIGENRILARKGIERLRKTDKIGLLALIEKSGAKKQNLGTYEIGFILAPRLNASGRLNTANKSLELLLTKDREKAWENATFLEGVNRERQELQKKVMRESIEIIEREGYAQGVQGIVLAKDDWHEGVVGIAASKMAEKYGRPTILISTPDRFGKGSGRSIKSFSLLNALDKCKEYLIRYGGHRYAAGITIDKEKIDDFRTAFNRVVAEQLNEEALISNLQIDCLLSFREINKELLSELENLEPYGAGNGQPVFMTSKIDFVGYPRIVGNNHLKVKVREDNIVLETIGFGKGEEAKKIETAKQIYTICYYLKENEYRNKKRIQLQLLHIE